MNKGYVAHAKTCLKKIQTALTSAEKTLRNPSVGLVHKELANPLRAVIADLTKVNATCGMVVDMQSMPDGGDALPTKEELKKLLDKCKKLDNCMVLNIAAAKKQHQAV